MPPIDQMQLSRRERQIMDILFEQAECSAQDVMTSMEDAPSYSAVRALIARLLDKKLVRFRIDGNKYIYSAVLEEEKAQESAIQRVLKTFFRGSRVGAVNALLNMEGDDLSDQEISEIERTIKKLKVAQKQGKS